ncbi:MAG TPA: hypothetical protein VGV40_11925 [Solirubrobacteraceae bacterium]|nr:hypothetical protein [Solirubrobacteraceae bacterium]
MQLRRRSASQRTVDAVSTAAKVWTGVKIAKGAGRAGKTGLKVKGVRRVLGSRGGRKATKYGVAARAAKRVGRGGGRKRLALLGLGGAVVAVVARKRSAKPQESYDWTTAPPPTGAGVSAGAPAAAADPTTTDPGGVSNITPVGTTDLDTPTHAAEGLGIDAPNHGATGLAPEAVDEQARDT